MSAFHPKRSFKSLRAVNRNRTLTQHLNERPLSGLDLLHPNDRDGRKADLQFDLRECLFSTQGCGLAGWSAAARSGQWLATEREQLAYREAVSDQRFPMYEPA